MAELIRSSSVLLAGGILLSSLLRQWTRLVDASVPKPYLDEYFHVGQAQTYCRGDYYAWDDKITTPPGLYVLSQGWLWLRSLPCSTGALRSTNGAVLSFVLFGCSYGLLSGQATLTRFVTAFNICLFPLLFFFSGLYYTDVPSTAFVLVHLLLAKSTRHTDISAVRRLLSGLGLLTTGTLALFFRQTNIFWVAVFPAGLQVLSLLPVSAPVNAHQSLISVFKTGFNSKTRYDVSIVDASFIDVVKMGVSLVGGIFGTLASPEHFATMFLSMLPFEALLLEFAGFVVWNGGVVLGDKSNHVATIHLAQMLYIWPYIAFFSWPLVLSTALGYIIPVKWLPPSLHLLSRPLPRLSLINCALMLSTAVATLAVIKYNTIVHPFTLADNRHYTFYVFRLLRRHVAVKYLAAPIYIVCAWLSLQSMGSGTTTTESAATKIKHGQDNKSAPIRSSSGDTTTGEVVVWVLTSALCLVTAPLVEPRYFILPWLTWRLTVPALWGSGDDGQATSEWRLDHRLLLESAWFTVVNAGTGYLFLYRGFQWPQEPGAVQRFMW